ncbi:MAG: Fe-S cluster assembly protein SufD [Bacteroidales bacterium]|nr:Fe-S cluster assembly protein SufD [Bacteroidales bacterium]
MDAVKQYIDLFEQTKETINNHSTDIMNSCREEALHMLKKLGLPSKKQQKYAHTDLEDYFGPDYGLNINRYPIPVNPYEAFKCDVPNLSTALYFLINDQYYNNEPHGTKYPDGTFIGSLKKFAESHPDIAEKYYGRLSSKENDGSVAINTLFAQDGFVVYVPKNVQIDKTVQLINVLGSETDFMINRRILVILEDNASVKLLICDHALNEVNFLATQVSEVFVGEGAMLDYYELEENPANTKRIASTFIDQQKGSNVMASSITLMNGKTRNNTYITFSGPGAESHLSGMAIEDGNQEVDNFTFIDHKSPHCKSNELYKYVLNDNATGSFAGRILVREGAQKTEAYQSNKNICATDTSHMFTRPELEIYADDVKCSHGATVGQLDNQALFYMRTRGLSEDEARMLLMFAFMSDVIDNIRLEPLRDRLRKLVEKRFRGELAKCRGCNECRPEPK